jgi:cardiolipin synthase
VGQAPLGSAGGPRRQGLRRLLGLRRGGPQPIATRAGQPLRPLTIPNLVGYVRATLIAVFLVVALPSDDGRVTVATVCFLVAAATDYLDGLLARVTGQYSRLGALMDPLIDRLLIMAGVVVDWKFELLPRWALAALAAREVTMVVIVALALRRGLDLEINWVGRIAVGPVMAGVGGVLIADLELARILFYAGLAGALLASVLYVRDGVRALRAPRPRAV